MPYFYLFLFFLGAHLFLDPQTYAHTIWKNSNACPPPTPRSGLRLGSVSKSKKLSSPKLIFETQRTHRAHYVMIACNFCDLWIGSIWVHWDLCIKPIIDGVVGAHVHLASGGFHKVKFKWINSKPTYMRHILNLPPSREWDLKYASMNLKHNSTIVATQGPPQKKTYTIEFLET